ncbi:hypothetical protein GCM10019016_132910 [Streptomyces prasinosporus]|uniref:Uncharacterized protein n=1 Tax=Streptomyces prasinosporus TaxID=68256 RepID=A0ABP6UIB7_9ACTN
MRPVTSSRSSWSEIRFRSEYRYAPPGGPTGASSRTSRTLSSYVGASYSGIQARRPEVCVSSWRTVTSCLPARPKSGRWEATVVSSPSAPRSICCTARIEVNSFDTEARSKTVSRAIGICCSAGNSTPVSVSSSYAR